jgi:BMFP domain-containing protein YqiC
MTKAALLARIEELEAQLTEARWWQEQLRNEVHDLKESLRQERERR